MILPFFSHSFLGMQTTLRCAGMELVEWSDEKNGLIFGHFSIQDHQLSLKIGEGSLVSHVETKLGETRVECQLDRLEISPWVSHLLSCDCRGCLSGNLSLSMRGQKMRKIHGGLFLENASICLDQWGVCLGGSHLEWEGEVQWDDPNYGKGNWRYFRLPIR